MTTRPLIVDCDPGQDDAVALLLAMASPDAFDLLGITAVAGNVPLDRTESNARRIRDLAGRPEVPVHAGCARPMVREPASAEFIHGESGIDGADLPEPRRRYGYDNLDFPFAWHGLVLGGECVALVPLPAYPLTAIATGQYTEAGRLWQANFTLDGPVMPSAPAESGAE